VAYSYIGPELTWAIYTDGTIGRAKLHLEQTAKDMNAAFGDGTAVVSVNKALVTQASSAIPVVPLYISILYKIMKAKGLHEGCIEQIHRLFADHYGADGGPQLDDKGRIRIDDWEMRPDVQAEVERSGTRSPPRRSTRWRTSKATRRSSTACSASASKAWITPPKPIPTALCPALPNKTPCPSGITDPRPVRMDRWKNTNSGR
jgi:hypothetical protein